MKKSVLIALLGLQSTEGIKVNSQPANQAVAQTNSASDAHKKNDTENSTNASSLAIAKNFNESANASNATSFAVAHMANETANASNATSLAEKEDDEQINIKNIDAETKKEMEAFDEEAENQIKAEMGSDSDSYAMLDEFIKNPDVVGEIGGPESPDLFSQVEADIHDEKEVAGTKDKARITKAKSCAEPKTCTKHSCKDKINPKNSSDEECACTPTPWNANEKAKIIKIQNERKEEAKAAREKATELRKKAEEAINAANEARMTAVQKSMELSNKAMEATQKSETSIVTSIRKTAKAGSKVSVFRGENFDLRTKRMTKQWEETLLRKHELWEIYKTLKKNMFVEISNVKIVKNTLK
jgi:hypothetical protein